MSNIWLTADTHFNHNREFIWKDRGFTSVSDMNKNIVQRWNEKIKPNDIVYHLGDVIMGGLDEGLKFVQQLNGKIYLAIGNHDSNARLEEFKKLPNIEDIQFGYRLKKGKKHFFLTHYPTLTGNLDNSKTYSIHGHTHFKSPFCEYNLMYHVGCDAHNCFPVAWEKVLSEITNKKFTFGQN